MLLSQSVGSRILSGAETAFRFLVFDFKEPLFGSNLAEAATLIPIAKAGKLLKFSDEAVDLFRFVSNAELDDITRTGKFAPGPNSLDAKQFGLSLDEVEALSTRLSGADAIVRARVPQSTLNALDRTPLDASILRSGAATAQPGAQLDLLNSTLLELERVR